jgi:hypothetical protein
MSPIKAKFRQELDDDYQAALVRLATLRADGEQYLLFAWVELFPFDMQVPDGWTSGDRPWAVPGRPGWSCAFSATRLTIAEALDWYEGAASGRISVGATNSRPVHLVPLGPEPIYGRLCAAVDAPFTFLWHGGPRIHRCVPLTEIPQPVQRLGLSAEAREWLRLNVGFDPYAFDEWLGGLALVAPDPVCSRLGVFPSARAEDGAEVLTIHAVPRRSESRGIADLSSLSVHFGERRVDGWTSVSVIPLDQSGHATVLSPQSHGQVGFALVCAKRGLLRLTEPLSWIEQVSVGMNLANQQVRVEVPSGGRRKPGKTVDVHRYIKGADIRVGESVKDLPRQRLAGLRERRKARDERANAPQKIFGVAADKAAVDAAEIAKRRRDAEDFIGGLVSGARRRVLFVDPFFGYREMRLFALRVTNPGVVPKILTGSPGLIVSPGPSRQPDAHTLIADLGQLSRESSVQAPIVRVMPGGDTPVIHDRYLIVDNEVWHCGPSFNELGERLGVIVRLPDPLSVRRVVSKIWCRATPLSEFWEQYRALREQQQ